MTNAAPLAIILAILIQTARGLYEVATTAALFHIPLKTLGPARLGALILDWWTRPATWIVLPATAALLYFPVLLCLMAFANDRSRLPRKNLSAGDLRHES